MKKYFDKYKHAIPLIVYAAIYLTWFIYLEKTVVPKTIIHMKADDLIPFCEIFVVPYFLWFAYVSIVVLYCFFKNKQEYCRACVFLFTGMTVFLVVSTLWPNGHHLRPFEMPRDNIFTALVARLYRTDTPTNLWPSIHVYNSIGAHLAVAHCFRLKGEGKGGRPQEGIFRFRQGILAGSFILCVSIILSTVLIKQHSLFDVLTAFVMAGIMYAVVYQFNVVAFFQSSHSGQKRNNRVRQV